MIDAVLELDIAKLDMTLKVKSFLFFFGIYALEMLACYKYTSSFDFSWITQGLYLNKNACHNMTMQIL